MMQPCPVHPHGHLFGFMNPDKFARSGRRPHPPWPAIFAARAVSGADTTSSAVLTRVTARCRREEVIGLMFERKCKAGEDIITQVLCTAHPPWRRLFAQLVADSHLDG